MKFLVNNIFFKFKIYFSKYFLKLKFDIVIANNEVKNFKNIASFKRVEIRLQVFIQTEK